MEEENKLTDFEVTIAEELLKVFKGKKNGERVTITYGELLERIGKDTMPANYLGNHLGKISKLCHEELDLPFISGIVVTKETGEPGDGFYGMLKDYKLESKYKEILEEAQTHRDWRKLEIKLKWEVKFLLVS